MIKIAFCDDNRSELDELQGLMNEYCLQSGQRIYCKAFEGSIELMTAMERGEQFDVLFLDIIMPGELGIDVAAEIRRKNDYVKIIFLTTTAEYAVQSYDVDAFYYVLKPVDRNKFFKIMDSVLAACQKESAEDLIVHSKGGITRVEIGKIEYCEVIHRTLYLNMTTGNVIECTGSMDELSEQLAPCGMFLRPHRSYLINMGYVHTITFRVITMNSGVKIPVPREKYSQIKDQILEYTFRKQGLE